MATIVFTSSEQLIGATILLPVWPQFLTANVWLHHIKRHDGFGQVELSNSVALTK